MSDDQLHTFRFGLNDDKCLRCNLDFDCASFLKCEPGKSFNELFKELINELSLKKEKYNE